MIEQPYVRGEDSLVPGAAEESVWLSMKRIYAETLAGEVGTVTELMHPGVTLWDSEIDDLALGVTHLQQLRGRDPLGTAPVMPVALDAFEPVVSVWGDTALLRHRLTVRFAPGSGLDAVQLRNTSVWRFEGGSWLLAHNHEDVWAAGEASGS